MLYIPKIPSRVVLKNAPLVIFHDMLPHGSAVILLVIAAGKAMESLAELVGENNLPGIERYLQKLHKEMGKAHSWGTALVSR